MSTHCLAHWVSPRLTVVEAYFLSLTDWVDLCAFFSVRLKTHVSDM